MITAQNPILNKLNFLAKYPMEPMEQKLFERLYNCNMFLIVSGLTCVLFVSITSISRYAAHATSVLSVSGRG